MFRTVIQASALIALICGAARADVRLPKVLSSKMVVQQQQPTVFWGWADKGEKVKVTFGESSGQTVVGDSGRWELRLAPPAAGGPYKITVEGNNAITLDDVLVGEVWVCSGQSNMQWSVRQALNPQAEIDAANYPKIRLFSVARNPAKEPQDDVKDGSWVSCSPQTAAGFSAVGYFFGRKLHQDLQVPVGLINTSWGGTIADAWTSRQGLETDKDFEPILERAKDFQPGRPNQASVLFNGMVEPLIPFSIRGVIWYQGESNVTRAQQYAKLFPAMIKDWRSHWKQGDFPFLYVQLAPFRYRNRDPRACAELWEAQLKTLQLKNTGMAVTTDIGNVSDIHPKNKQEVGRRLALWALAKSYGKKDLVYSGPLYQSMKIEGGKIRLTFSNVGGGLVADGGKLTDFTIADDDGKFVEANAEIDGEYVVVSSDQVAKPAAVRFAWKDDAEPNFFNQAGLPASPFRTDDFEMVTAGSK